MPNLPTPLTAAAALSLALAAAPLSAQTPDSTAAKVELAARAARAAAVARAVAWYGTPFVAERDAPHGAGTVVDGVDLPPAGARGTTRRFQLFDRIIVTPPAGMRATSGDSVLLVRRGPALGAGQVLLPTGIAVVDGEAGVLRTARLVRVYDVVAAEQSVLPVPTLPVVDSTAGRTVSTDSRLVWVDGNAELPSLQRTVVLAGGSATALHEGDRIELVGDGRRIAGGPTLPGTRAAIVRVVRVTPFAASARIESQEQPGITIGMSARTLQR